MYKRPVAVVPAKSVTSGIEQSIEVEVRMTDGGFYVAFVRSIEEQSSQLYVTFEQKQALLLAFCLNHYSVCSWQSGQCVPWTACRLAPRKFFVGERRIPLFPPEAICVGRSPLFSMCLQRWLHEWRCCS